MAKGLLAGVITLLVSACSPLSLLNLITAPQGFDSLKTASYGSLPQQKLSVYLPANKEGPAPTVVFFYGGRWQTGSREEYRFAAQALASQGFIVVVPDYRLYPEVTFPTFVEDAALAVKWVFENAADLGGDAACIALMGHSAGAHIAAMLALDERFLNQVGVPEDSICALVGLAGPYDFLPLEDEDLRQIFGPPEQFPLSQPIRFVDEFEPPALLLQGADDETVKPHNATRLAERIRASGGTAKAILYPSLNHTEILVSLASPLRRFAPPVLEDAAAFIHDHCAASHKKG